MLCSAGSDRTPSSSGADGKPQVVSVNISASNLLDDGFGDMVTGLLDRLTSLGFSFDQTRIRTRVEETPWLTT